MPRFARRFTSVPQAVDAVTRLVAARVVPAALELDRRRLPGGGGGVSERPRRWRRPAPARCCSSKWTGCPNRWRPKPRASSRRAARPARPRSCAPRRSGARGTLARAARDLAVAQGHHAAQVQSRRRRAEGARAGALRPRRRRCEARFALRIPCFGHVGDGNIHVNIMVTPGRRGRDSARARGRAGAVRGRRRAGGVDQRRARDRLREGAVSGPGTDAGDHCADARVKQAFDPTGS